MKKNILLSISILGIVLFIFNSLSCKTKSTAEITPLAIQDPNTMANKIRNSFEFTHLDSALILSSYFDTLNSKAAYTLFATPDKGYPTDQNGLFYSNGNYYFQFAEKNFSLLKSVITYPLIKGILNLKTLSMGMDQVYKNVVGEPIFISKFTYKSDTLILVDGKKVVVQDLKGDNGNIEVLDSLIFPSAQLNLWEALSGSGILPISWNQFTFYNGTQSLYNPGLQNSLFNHALMRLGYDKLLQGNAYYTILVSIDPSFDYVPIPNPLNPFTFLPNPLTFEQIDTMNKSTLTNLMNIHILPGIHFVNDILLGNYNGKLPISLPSYGTESIRFKSTNTGTDLSANGNNASNFPFATINTNLEDIVCSNGVIHFIQNEIFP